MNIEMAVDIFQMLVVTALFLISPILGTAIGIGLVVSLLQTVTSIQDQTLTFAPKLVGVGIMMIVGAHWMMRNLMEFTMSFFERLVEMAP